MSKKKRTLPKYLTTVTPFSKLLAAALFIVLPFFAFKLGMEFQEKLSFVGLGSNSLSESDTSWKIVVIEPSKSLATPFRKFTLSYPATWTLAKEDLKSGSIIVTLRKDRATITFKQVEEGKGDCYYSDQNQKAEMMAVDYINFSELKKGKLTWRVAETAYDGSLFDVCELQADGRYGGFTSIGSISMKDSSYKSENLEDFKLILNKILIQ